jgi:hypothetical protein
MELMDSCCGRRRQSLMKLSTSSSTGLAGGMVATGTCHSVTPTWRPLSGLGRAGRWDRTWDTWSKGRAGDGFGTAAVAVAAVADAAVAAAPRSWWA